MTVPYHLYLCELSCFVDHSTDLGSTWADVDPSGILDGLTDLVMAFQDADWSTMVCFDIGVHTSNQSALLLSVSGQDGPWTEINPDSVLNPPDDPDNWIMFISGAITEGAHTMLACPFLKSVGGVQSDGGPLRLSLDRGVTWHDTATDLGSRQWITVCIAEGGEKMYANSSNNQVAFSTDGGLTWGDLPTSPVSTAPLDLQVFRICCSQDGSTIVLADGGATARLWISDDSGATWTNALSTPGDATSAVADCGVSWDGQTMIAVLGGGASDAIIYVSTNGGTSWVTTNLGPGRIPVACSVSPDGVVFLVGVGTSFIQAAVSTDDGATFLFNHVLPADSPVRTALVALAGPNPPPPPATREAAYIIERLDNRIWPTIEDCWCVDCGFTLAQPTPDADLDVDTATGIGTIIGVENLIGGADYSTATTVDVVDDNGLGAGSGAVPVLTITGGVITAITFFSGGTGYVYPRLVFNDPTNAGSGASADVTLDNSATFTASDPVFSAGDIGSVIRAGYGSAIITAFTDTATVTANILTPLVKINADSPNAAPPVQTQKSGTWTMTVPVSQVYLPQLAGFTITGLADGKVVSPRVVPDDGLVTLDDPASAIILGLGFVAQVQSNRLDAGEPTIQGQRKKIAAVTARLESSAAFTVGANQPDGAAQNPIEIAPEWQDLVDALTHAIPPFSGAATPLFTGDVRLPLPGGWNTRGQVALQQDQPLPLQILDLVPETLSGDDPSNKVPPRQKKEK
jgi:hypothetical protein